MRRKDREVTDFYEIINILDKCSVLHLSMISNGMPYSVPVNFGYYYFLLYRYYFQYHFQYILDYHYFRLYGYIIKEENGTKRLSVYIHGAGEGKKVSALRVNPAVSFSGVAYSQTDSLSEDKSIPCNWTCYYDSVIGFGNVTFLEHSAEKSVGLDAIMLHNGYRIPKGIKTIAYAAMKLARTSVIRIDVSEITGKKHKSVK